MPEIPGWLATVATLLFGLVVGSFVNVLVARLPHGLSVVRPRSRCPSCETPIAWYDNVPVLSFVLLRGKCRKCQTSISIRYPVIELLTALLFLAAKTRFGFNALVILRDWPWLAALVAITFIDLEHRIIPDELSLGLLGWGLLTCPFSHEGWLPSVTGAAIGFGFFYAVAYLYERFTGRSGLGGGDIKLLAMLGAWVGPSGVMAAILISSIFGSLLGLVWGLWSGEKNVMKTSIPYGPFLVVGGLYYYFLGDLLWFRFMTPI